jgi:hypothetical protein
MATPDVPTPENIEPKKEPQFEIKTQPDTAAFKKLMEKPISTEKGEQLSPIEISQKQQASLSPSFESITGQMTISENQLNDIKDKLNTPNLSLKNSHQRLLTAKLDDSFEHLQKASNYLGADQVQAPEIPKDAEPIVKFLGYVTNGQNQLLAAKQRLEDIQSKGGELKPGEMLLVQINLSQAQQEIEFSSLLLSKVVDSIKQTISIQL